MSIRHTVKIVSMVDNADELILSALSKNSRQDIKEIRGFSEGSGI